MTSYNVKVLSSENNHPALTGQSKRTERHLSASFLNGSSLMSSSPRTAWTIGSYWTHAGKATPKAPRNRAFSRVAGSGLIASEWVARLNWEWMILCIWTHQPHFSVFFQSEILYSLSFCFLCVMPFMSRNEERRESKWKHTFMWKTQS